VAVIATLVQTQTSVHYAHLAEMVTPASPLGRLVPEMQALFMQQGASAALAYQTTIQYLILLVQRQATILAMQDAFRVSLVLTVAAIIAAFFVRSRRVQARPERRAEQPLTDEERAASEAMSAAL
jgi:hypothetical protein